MVYVAIKELNPAVYNPRKWSKKATDDLTASIKRFGLIDPIIVNKARGNTVVGGHFRLHVAKKLGYIEVPCVFVSIEDEQKEKELNLRLNKNSGDWDWSLLKDWETSLLKEAGFDDAELKEMMDQVLEPVKEDDFDATATLEAKETKVKPGDVWQLGTHMLMCGDSTKLEDVEKLMDGKKADMVFTDPPYGVSYQSNMRGKGERFDVLENDDRFIVEWIPLVATFSTGFIFIWSSWKVIARWIEETEILGDMTNVIIWDKGGGGIGDLKKTFSTDFEMALVWHRGNELKGKRLGSVWSIGKDGSTTYAHPTQKPIELAATAIQNVTDANNIVLDLFAGSGSTLIACEQTKRICYTMELDPKYCDVVIARWEKLTGQTAIKL